MLTRRAKSNAGHAVVPAAWVGADAGNMCAGCVGAAGSRASAEPAFRVVLRVGRARPLDVAARRRDGDQQEIAEPGPRLAATTRKFGRWT
jgi:hypothetical protein